MLILQGEQTWSTIAYLTYSRDDTKFLTCVDMDGKGHGRRKSVH